MAHAARVMLRLLSPCLLLLGLLGACSGEDGSEDDFCSNENVIDDVDDGADAAGTVNGAY
jgi:hypothetical protein